MSVITLLLVALGVSADAFAVALGKGLQLGRVHARSALAIALTFGVFQGAMPLLGWLLASRFRDYVVSVDHWIAFVLLAGIGLKMVVDSVRGTGGSGGPRGQVLGGRELLVLGLATSIDALAVGISLAFVDVSILAAGLLIGVVTFVLSLVAVVLGATVGGRFGGTAEIVGGLVLIAIGTRILVEHLTGGG